MTVYIRYIFLVYACIEISAFISSPASVIRNLARVLPGSDVDLYLPNYRFSSKSINVTINSGNVNDIPTILSTAIQVNGIEISRITFGIAICPSIDTMIPIHDGIIQAQHATKLHFQQPSSENIVLCSFSPRATHVCTAPEESERPVSPERLESLNAAILRLGSTTPDELLSDEYAGTPPARIYRSFVSPRPKAVHILEPVERAANRTAMQIELALRQVRADKALYLRNTDKTVVPSTSNDGTATTPHVPVHPIVLVLDNIRSAFNVGSMFRTAETAGAAEIVTCGITAHPPHPKLRKTAFSSLDVVPTRHFDDTMVAVEALRSEGYTIVAMETTERSQIYTKVQFPKKVALVLGNEVTGVDTRIMEAADLIVEIPTFGVKNSLNVASAAPIVVFEVLRQWSLDP